MTVRSPLTTLLFDFGGTLDADGVAWKERFHAYYRAEGLDIVGDAFAPAFYAADDGIADVLPPETGLAGTVAYLAHALEAALARRGVSERSDGVRARRVAERFLADAASAFARNRDLLKALKGRYRLGVVANFYGNLDAVCREASLATLFGAVTDSRRVGAEKPAPAIFAAALRSLGSAPATAVMVGDSLRRDRTGAERIGMDFIWIAPPEAQAARQRTEAVPRRYPAVTRLTDLAEMLL